MSAWWEEHDLQLYFPRGDFDWFELEAAWAQAYGSKPRDPGWLQAKMEREGCSQSENAFLRAEEGTLVAFFLTGNTDDATRHGLGLGVLPEWRGKGLGRALVKEVAEQMSKAPAFRELVCEIESERYNFYQELGFTPQSQNVHLRHVGCGSQGPALVLDIPASAHISWKRCAWERTPAAFRRVVVYADARIGLTREGGAWLAHWWSPARLAQLARPLRDATTSGEPIFLYGLDVNDPAMTYLKSAGWVVAQSFERWTWSPAED